MNKEGVSVHLYGKNQTKPFRKIGHITIVHPDLETAIENAKSIQGVLKIVS